MLRDFMQKADAFNVIFFFVKSDSQIMMHLVRPYKSALLRQREGTSE